MLSTLSVQQDLAYPAGGGWGKGHALETRRPYPSCKHPRKEKCNHGHSLIYGTHGPTWRFVILINQLELYLYLLLITMLGHLRGI